jgi:hypothetical protein
MSTSSASRRTHDDYALVCSELGRAEQRPFDPLSLAAFLPVRARILLRLLDSPFQSATERNQLCSVMVPERNFPRPPVDGSVGITFVGLVDNPDTSHDTFPSLPKRKSESR